MVFKDRTGKNLEVGQKGLYLDPGMLDVEILEIEQLSVMDGGGPRNPKIAVKMYLNFPNVPPNVSVIAVGNLRIVEDAPPKISSSRKN